MLDIYEELRQMYKKHLENKIHRYNLLWLLVIPLAGIVLVHFWAHISARF